MMLNVKKNGTLFRVSNNQKFKYFWEKVFANQWEEFTFRVFDHYLQPDKNYLDIGAWIGPTSLYAAHRAKHTFAVEPDPIAFHELLANISLNPSIQHKITPINKALSHKSGIKKLYRRMHFGDSSSSLIPTLQQENFHKVEATTLKNLLEDYTVNDLSLVKIDIEGGEYVLLPSIKGYLKKYKPPLFLSIHPNFLQSYLQTQGLSQKEQEKAFFKLTKNLVKSLNMYEYIYLADNGAIASKELLHLLETRKKPLELLFSPHSW
jgi:FkbM family methyltransferase